MQGCGSTLCSCQLQVRADAAKGILASEAGEGEGRGAGDLASPPAAEDRCSLEPYRTPSTRYWGATNLPFPSEGILPTGQGVQGRACRAGSARQTQNTVLVARPMEPLRGRQPSCSAGVLLPICWGLG